VRGVGGAAYRPYVVADVPIAAVACAVCGGKRGKRACVRVCVRCVVVPLSLVVVSPSPTLPFPPPPCASQHTLHVCSIDGVIDGVVRAVRFRSGALLTRRLSCTKKVCCLSAAHSFQSFFFFGALAKKSSPL
jgi:hypothetical protein